MQFNEEVETARSGIANTGGGCLFFKYRITVNARQLSNIHLPPVDDHRFDRTSDLRSLGNMVGILAGAISGIECREEEYGAALTPRGTHFFDNDAQQGYMRIVTEANTTVETLNELGIPFQAEIIRNECLDVNGNPSNGPIRIRPHF